MNYIIFDLEINSKPFKNKRPNEIIEIGAIKIDENLLIKDSFQSFIKPTKYKKLFTIIKNKTNISQSDINNADDFITVINNFIKWIGDDSTLCCWGHDDIHHLKTNSLVHDLTPDFIKETIDIQKQFSIMQKTSMGQKVSLKEALRILEIDVTEELHRALIDAEYTAKIFIKCFQYMYTTLEISKK